MRSFHAKLVFCLTGLLFLSARAGAAPISNCAPDFSSCDVYENQFLNGLSFLPFSGDVIVKAPSGTTVDVFRIFNDVIDTGGGTGLGETAYFYGMTNLPSPSTYSVNAVFVTRGGTGPTGFYETDYTNLNGPVYRLFTPAPEPGTLGLLTLGAVLGGALLRKRLTH